MVRGRHHEEDRGAMDLNVFSVEQRMLAGAAEADRQARLAWMEQGRFAPRPARRNPARRARDSLLLALGGLLESAGWALLRFSTRGG
jgi:hypothetical protein